MQSQQINLALSNEDIFHLGVKTILKNVDNKILVLKVEKGANTYWDLPGGRVQINEDIETAARREIAEETGITDIQNLHHIGMIKSNLRIPISQGHTVGLIFSFYMGEINNDTITMSSEHFLYEWMDQQNAVEILQHSYGASFIDLINAQQKRHRV